MHVFTLSANDSTPFCLTKWEDWDHIVISRTAGTRKFEINSGMAFSLEGGILSSWTAGHHSDLPLHPSQTERGASKNLVFLDTQIALSQIRLGHVLFLQLQYSS